MANIETAGRFLKLLVFIIILCGFCGYGAPQSMPDNFTLQSTISSGEDSALCIRDLKAFLADLSRGEMYAFRMIDSAGKFPSGFLEGNFRWIGTFQECLDIEVLENRNFSGRFCTVDIALPLTSDSTKTSDDANLPLQIGLCIPDSCSENNVESLLNRNDSRYIDRLLSLPPFLPTSPEITVDKSTIAVLFKMAKIKEVHCTRELKSSEVKNAIIILGVAAIFAVLVFIGTLLDVIDAYYKPASRIDIIEGDDIEHLGTIETYRKIDCDQIIDGQLGDNNGSVPLTKVTSSDCRPTSKREENTCCTQIDTEKSQNPDNNEEKEESTRVIEDQRENTFTALKINPKISEGDLDDKDKPSFMKAILIKFSLKRNTDQLHEDWSNPPVPYLKGIYVLSIWWMILALSWEVDHYSDNPIQLLYTGERFISQSITFYTFSWDTLFLVSGFIITWVTLEELENKKFNLFIFWLRRICKFSSLYLFMRYFWALSYTYFVGPLYRHQIEKSVEYCFTDWWAYLMYWNNLYPFPGNNDENCFYGSWFLSNLMQFYFICPIIVYILYRWWKIGLGLVGVLITCCLTCLAVLSWYYGLSPSYVQDPYNENGVMGKDYIYNKPYTRCAPFLVGILLGFILQRHGNTVKKNKIKWAWYGIGWAVAIATGLSLVYGLYGTWHGNELSQAVSVFYLTVSRFAWALAVGWMIFACATGYGGPINAFLSWKAWNPLANLSYAAYLIYPIVIQISLTWRERLVHVQDYPIFYLFVGHTGFTYAYAYILSMLIEIPFQQLQKKSLRKKHIDII